MLDDVNAAVTVTGVREGWKRDRVCPKRGLYAEKKCGRRTVEAARIRRVHLPHSAAPPGGYDLTVGAQAVVTHLVEAKPAVAGV